MSLEERLSSPAKVQSLSTESVPSKLGEELVELVRVRTGLSYAKSMDALSAVFSHIVDSVPAVGDTMEQIMQSLQGMSVSLLSCLLLCWCVSLMVCFYLFRRPTPFGDSYFLNFYALLGTPLLFFICFLKYF